MSGTELISGMGELVNHIRELEEENKKLKEEIAHKNKLFGEWCEENRKLKDTILRWQEKADFDLSDSDDEDLTEPESDKP